MKEKFVHHEVYHDNISCLPDSVHRIKNSRLASERRGDLPGGTIWPNRVGGTQGIATKL